MSQSAEPSTPSDTAGLGPVQARDFRIGVTRLGEHMLNHAELIFRRVLDAAPGHAAANRYLGVTLFKLARREEGLAHLWAAVELDPQAADAWRDLAAALQRLGQANQAADAYARAGEAGEPPPHLRFATEGG